LGRKVHPTVFRLGVNRDWSARWYAEGAQYAALLHEDLAIRNLIKGSLKRAAIAEVEIERFQKQVIITIHTAKPGIIIGRRGATVATLRKELEDLTSKKIRVEVKEIKRPEIVAALIAEGVVEQLEKRVSHKRAMKQAVQRAIRGGAKGVRIICAGRLSGSEMARRERVHEGRVPLHTLRADIDYARTEALTTFGRIGVKVWVHKGEAVREIAPIEQPAGA
jgi:small subunit ribosomal protein S3